MTSFGAAEPIYPSRMHTIQLSEEELRLLLSAVRSYRDDFGHEEAELLAQIKALLQKLESAAG